MYCRYGDYNKQIIYRIIYCRLLIAVMHFNENYGRKQAVTKTGIERLRLCSIKTKKGECTPKIVPVPPTYCK